MADDLLQQVNDLGSVSWSGTVFRHTAPSREGLSGAGALIFGGRWNPANLVSTIYFAAPEDACIAEFVRMAQGQGKGVASFLPRTIHQVEVVALRVLDLVSRGNLRSVGLAISDIEAGEWDACQEVGRLAYYLGLQGVVAPSATGAGIVLAVFEPSVTPGQLRVVRTKPMSSIFD